MATLSVVLGSAMASAPAAHAEDGDLVAPLAQAPVGAIVKGVWDSTFLAAGPRHWYLSSDRGASWTTVRSDDDALDDTVGLQSLDAEHAVLVANEAEDDENGNTVTNSTVWVVDHAAHPVGVRTIKVAGQHVAAASASLAIAETDGHSTAIDLATAKATSLQTEVTDPEVNSWWVLGKDTGLHVTVAYGSDGMTPVRSVIDPTPLDGSSTGDKGFEVKGGVSAANFTTTGVDYVVLRRTTGASTFQFDYCTRAAGALTSACDVLKSGISARDTWDTAAYKLGGFVELKVRQYLYVSNLVRNAATGKLPPAVRVTGVNADHWPDGSRTLFAERGSSVRPIVTDTTATTGGVFEVASSGRATRISEGPRGPVVPEQLSLSATRTGGVDERRGGSAWLRDLADFDAEHVVSTRGRQAMVSAGRTAVNTADGLFLGDQGRQVAKLSPWLLLGEMSGPYLLGVTSMKARQATLLAGTKPVAFGPFEYPIALFGSTFAAVSWSEWALIIDDVSTGSRVRVGSVPLDDFDQLDSVWLWGDTVVVAGVLMGAPTDTTTVRFTDFRKNAQWERAFPDGAEVLALGDGAAVIRTGNVAGWQVVNVASHELTPLAGASDRVAPVVDGAGRVLYATETDLVVHKLLFAGGSAPRALWTSSAKAFNSLAGESSPFTVSVDATKAVGSGSLVLTGGGLAAPLVRPVTASPDGSLRIAWDGKLDDLTAAKPGTYAWHLEGFDGLVAVDGTSVVGGQFAVTNDPVAYPQVAPVIDHPKPVTDMVLTADPGPHPSDAAISYQWYRNTTAITGATGASYTVSPSDVGRTLKVKVSFSKAANYLNSAKYSRATAKVGRAALVKGTVTLSDPAPQVDTPVSAVLDGWEPAPVVASYQWYRVNARGTARPMAKARKASYTPTGSDRGYRLKVVMTASKPGYSGASVASAVSPAVLPGEYQAVPEPVILGTARVDMTLTVDPGTYRHVDGQQVAPTFSYQWYRVKDGTRTAIRYATRATYKAVPADEGSALLVKVVARRSGYADQASESDPTGVVGAPMKAGTATIEPAPAVVGVLLTASTTGWVPDGVALAYQWYRGTSAITGADQASYTPVAADLGKKLRVKVTGSADGYASVGVYSAYTALVIAQ